MRKNNTNELQKEILYQKYINEKKSTNQIAKELNCSSTKIGEWLEIFNIPKRSSGEKNPRPDITKEILYHKYIIEQKSSNEIAKDLNVSTTTIFNKLKKFGIQRRTLKETHSSEKTKNLRKETNMSKYGTISPIQNDKIKNKMIETKISKGIIQTIDGKLISDLSKEINISVTHLCKLKREYGEEYLKSLKIREKNILEEKIENILKNSNINYKKDKYLNKKYRYDFLIEDYKLIIECDGYKWHCEEGLKKRNKNFKNYHLQKKQEYRNYGYKSLFFRWDEILLKLPIIESILKHHFNLSQKIGARKCSIKKINKKEAKEFFKNNHLMGNGNGETFALYFNNKIFMAIQLRYKNKIKNILEISRFCSKLNYSVAGGFSKLLNHVEKIYKPNQIITFIDERYGDGNYLENLLFKKQKTYPSFKWTDGFKTYHRMKFPNNTGYENNLTKIWDCGQTKWIKTYSSVSNS